MTAGLLTVFCVLLGSAVAQATTLHWSTPASMYGSQTPQTPSALACPSSTLCVAVDSAGDVLLSTDPGSARPAWKIASIDPGHALQAVSCASETLCAAVDEAGSVFVSTAPTTGGWQSHTVAGTALKAISCPSTSLCVAVDQAGEEIWSTDPGSGALAKWSVPFEIDGAHPLTGISCAEETSCVAIDQDGRVLVSDAPATSAPWRPRAIDAAGALQAVSCPARERCVVVDAVGDALSSVDPLAAAPTWSTTAIDAFGELSGVACVTGEQCVSVDRAGQALVSDESDGIPPLWSASSVELATALEAVACVQGSFCLALDAQGRSSSTPLPALTPPAGAPAPPVAIVRPHPSIVGIPAVGERLRCLPGVAEDGSLGLAYVWVRDDAPISGASGSAYRVAGVDAQHHLQCQVTATDAGGSATAHSAFVAVPAAGVLAAIGETKVGRLTLGRRGVRVVVNCSPQATRGCTLEVRLSAFETLRRRHVLALWAHRPRPRAGVRAVAVALGSERVHVGTGAALGVSVSLDARATRLLRRLRRLPASLSVHGTVIGALSAELLHEELVFSSRGRARSARVGPVGEPTSPPAPARVATVHPAHVATAAPAGATADPVLAGTPYMGWDTYFAFGGRYSEASVLEQASKLVTLGLRPNGYRYVWLDAGWWNGRRAPHGEIVVDRAQWPHGMAWLARTLHAAGLRVGLYTDAGREGCGGARQGSFGHYRQDADTFATWGFDAVKVDFCGGVRQRLDPKAAYSSFHAAIESDRPRRPMLFSVCNFLEPGQVSGAPAFAQSAFSSYLFGPTVGTSWRTDTDVGSPGYVTFPTVLRNLDADAAHPEAAGPGHWNDPDYLGPDQGLTAAQFDTQLSMWAMLAAPLMVSDDLTHASAPTVSALGNAEVIAVDQDAAGVQGRLLSWEGGGQVWVKPLRDGSRAVALLNRGSQPVRIQTSATAVGMPSAPRYALRDLWAHTTTVTTGAIAAEVPGESTVLLRVLPTAELRQPKPDVAATQADASDPSSRDARQ